MNPSKDQIEPSRLDELISVLQDKSEPGSRNRERAAWSILELGEARGLDAVIAVLQDTKDDFGIRIHIANYLGLRRIERAFSILLQVVTNKNDDIHVRINSTSALGRFRRTSVVEPLLVILGDRQEATDLRRVVACVLGDLGDAQAVQPLINALNDTIVGVQVDSILALGALGDARVVQPLMELLVDRSTHWTVRGTAVSVLGNLAEKHNLKPLSDTFFGLLTDETENWWVRESSALALGRLGDSRTFECLIAGLSDPDRLFRFSVIRVLGQLVAKRAVEPLIAVLETDVDEEARATAAIVLGQLGDKKAIEPLIRALKDECANVRSCAIGSLYTLRDERIVGPIITVLRDEDVYVRHHAIGTLGAIGDARALPALEWIREHDTGVYEVEDDEEYGSPESLKQVADKAIKLITQKQKGLL